MQSINIELSSCHSNMKCFLLNPHKGDSVKNMNLSMKEGNLFCFVL